MTSEVMETVHSFLRRNHTIGDQELTLLQRQGYKAGQCLSNAIVGLVLEQMLLFSQTGPGVPFIHIQTLDHCIETRLHTTREWLQAHWSYVQRVASTSIREIPDGDSDVWRVLLSHATERYLEVRISAWGDVSYSGDW